MIQFDQFGFAAPPCTASRWFLLGCKFAEMPSTLLSEYYIPIVGEYRGFMLSTVRHPLCWLCAYFKYQAKSKTPLIGVPEVDLFYSIYLKSDGKLLQFLEIYLEQHPGSVGRVFDSYRPSSVMRFEDFPWGAVEFLRSIGEMKTGQLERAGVDIPHGLMRDRDIRRVVVKAERDFCNRFEYY